MSQLPDGAYRETEGFPPHPSSHELIARAIVVRDDALLVNQGRKRDGTRYFALPGGHVDPGENAPFALAREFEEELDASVEVGDLAFVSEQVYGSPQRHELVLFFHATISRAPREENGRVLSPESSKAFQWLPMSQLSSAPLVPPALKAFLLGTDAARYKFETQSATSGER